MWKGLIAAALLAISSSETYCRWVTLDIGAQASAEVKLKVRMNPLHLLVLCRVTTAHVLLALLMYAPAAAFAARRHCLRQHDDDRKGLLVHRLCLHPHRGTHVTHCERCCFRRPVGCAAVGVRWVYLKGHMHADSCCISWDCLLCRCSDA